MKILMMCGPTVNLSTPYQGGTEAFVDTLSNTLGSQYRCEVDVVANRTDLAEGYATIAMPQSIFRLQDRLSSDKQGQQRFQAMSLSMIRSHDYDVVHYHSFNPAVYEAGLLHANKSVVVTLHIPPNPKQICIHKHFSACVPAQYFTVSHRMKRMWQPYVKVPIQVIPNGINIQQWQFEDQHLRSQLIWIGRISSEKNPVAAIEFAKSHNLPIELVGPCFDERYYEQKVRPLLNDDVRYLGVLNQSDLNKRLNESIAQVAFGNWHEPFGLTYIESMRSGVPVIGNSNAIINELHDLPGVFVTDEYQNQNMESLFASFNNKFRQSIRDSVTGYSLNRVAEHYLAAYGRVADAAA